MINFAVINLKNLFKNLIKISFVIALVVGIMNITEIFSASFKKINYFETLKNSLKLEKKEESSEKFFESVVAKEIAINETKIKSSNSDYNKIAESHDEKEKENLEVQEESKEEVIDNEDKIEKVVSSVPASLPTSVVQSNNLAENYNTVYKTIKIKNETNFNLTQELLTPNIEFSDKKNILIFHTHTCESYTQTKENSYTPSGNYRTTDLNYSVAKVGTVLEENLTQKGFNVVHDMTYHDYPAYNNSYNRSLNTVKNLLKKNPTTQLVIDLHRDAIGSMSNYAPAVKIGDEVVSQVMFVIGTNGGGMEHPNWQTNLKLAIKIQEKANELYPGLFRPIILRNSRYNQNLADGACIIEVGATGNTLEQTTGAMKYLSEVIAQVMK